MDKLLEMIIFQNNATNIKRFVSDGVMADNLKCDWFLLYYQRFKIRVNTILDKTSFDWYPLGIPKELEIIFYS